MHKQRTDARTHDKLDRRGYNPGEHGAYNQCYLYLPADSCPAFLQNPTAALPSPDLAHDRVLLGLGCKRFSTSRVTRHTSHAVQARSLGPCEPRSKAVVLAVLSSSATTRPPARSLDSPRLVSLLGYERLMHALNTKAPSPILDRLARLTAASQLR